MIIISSITKKINIEFSNFCNTEIEVSRQIVSLLEKEMSEKKETHLGEVWTMFQATIIDMDTNEL